MPNTKKASTRRIVFHLSPFNNRALKEVMEHRGYDNISLFFREMIMREYWYLPKQMEERRARQS